MVAAPSDADPALEGVLKATQRASGSYGRGASVRSRSYGASMQSFDQSGISSRRLDAFREVAEAARPRNYSRYSGFMVLAAVETGNGVFGGSNVENVNYSLTKHAEEVAILAAIQGGAGPQGRWLRTLYVAGPPPCGSCRQFAAEFARRGAIVLIDRLSQAKVRRSTLAKLSTKAVEVWTIEELLPGAFRAVDLKPRV